MKYILKYKDNDFYHNRKLFIETYMRSINDKILVEISDFTVKDGAIDKDWIPVWLIGLPIEENDIKFITSNSNPKYRLYTKEEFDSIFDIIEIINID